MLLFIWALPFATRFFALPSVRAGLRGGFHILCATLYSQTYAYFIVQSYIFFPFVRGVLSKHIYIHSTRGMIEGAMIFMHSYLFCSCRYDLRREHSTCTLSRPF